jgi:serine/threonine protein kinase
LGKVLLEPFIRYGLALTVSVFPKVAEERCQYLLKDSEVEQGTVPDGETIAVKKLAENSPLPRDKAFNNEVQNIMALQHKNVVRLVGYCHESQKKVVQNNGRYIVADIVESLLCYEYLAGGSLKKNLFGMSIFLVCHTTRFKLHQCSRF